ncbi:MAG: Maf family protein [Proteobacteria bacterium]|nr:Maf family protein [Pseudomonadota bacterium]
MSYTRIILASQSPRRKLLLQQIGIEPICKPVDIDESVHDAELPLDYCSRLALEKAREGWMRSDKNLPVLGSDTIVVLDNQILGKPKNEDDAKTMLLSLADNHHDVITAVAVVDDKKHQLVTSISHVIFGAIPTDELLHYVASKEPLDKAGSYGIQGYASRWIKHISGSHSGIMGLPLYETTQLMREFT